MKGDYLHEQKDNEVLRFIDRFYRNVGDNPDSQEILRHQFRSGYCYYFAHILKIAFGRGEVCWCAPFGHFCWVDDDGCPYDCEGYYYGEVDYLIPEYFLGEALNDFLHTDKVFNASKEDIDSIVEKYLKKERKI